MDSQAESLSFNAFEHLMWADDRPETPMVFYLRVTLKGRMDEATFRKAVQLTLPDHPLLKSFAVGHPHLPSRKIKWKEAPSTVQPHIDWVEGTREFHAPSGDTRIDLTKEIGVRFFIRLLDGKTTVLVQLHHASSDARGGCRFIEDILAHYHVQVKGGDSDDFRRFTDSTTLVHRDGFQLTNEEFKKRRLIDLQRIFAYFRWRPEVMSHRKVKRKVPLQKICAQSGFDISGDDLTKLKKFAKRHKVTINDVLLRDLFLTIDHWNGNRLRRRGAKSVRLAMAVDMRRTGDETLPAANIVSMVFLDRKPHEMKAPEDLLRSINRETSYIKKNYLGFALIRATRWFSGFRGGFKLLMQPTPLFPCHSTAVLSNLGMPLLNTNLPKADNGDVEIAGHNIVSWELMPPYRPNTPLAVGVGTVGNCLKVALHYNPQVLNFQEVQVLRAYLEACIRDNIEGEALEDLIKFPKPTRPSRPSLWSYTIGKNVIPRAPEPPALPPKGTP